MKPQCPTMSQPSNIFSQLYCDIKFVSFPPLTYVYNRVELIRIFRYLFIFKIFKVFIHLAALDFSCGMQDLDPQPGIKPRLPALGAPSLSHWTTREVPKHLFLKQHLPVFSVICVYYRKSGNHQKYTRTEISITHNPIN